MARTYTAVISLIALFFSFNIVRSQKSSDWGINFGGTITSLRGNDYARNINYDIGILLGILYEIEITPGISLVTNLNYERRTIKERGIYYNTNLMPIEEYSYRNKYHYINIPVLIKVPFGQKELWYVNMGPFLDILWDESIRREGINSSFKTLDYGLATGLGKAFPSGKGSSFILELRSEWGLANTMGFESMDPAAQKKRTSTMKLLLTWAFN